MDTETGGIGLEYEVERLDKGLRLSYRVTNESDESIFLTTPLGSADDMEVGDAARAYTYVDDEGIVRVSKRLWEVPDDVDVYAPEVPRLTEVPAGCQFEEAVTVSLPLRSNHPYADEVSVETRSVGEAKGLSFAIGYLLAEQVAGLAGQTKEGEGMVVDYATCAEGQHLLEGEVLGVRVVVEVGNG